MSLVKVYVNNFQFYCGNPPVTFPGRELVSMQKSDTEHGQLIFQSRMVMDGGSIA